MDERVAMPEMLQHVEVPGEVRLGIDMRVGDRGAHAGLRREVDDDVERVIVERRAERIAVGDLGLAKGEAGRRFSEVAKPRLLERDIVVVVEVVDPKDVVATRREGPDAMIADEAGRACDQNPQLIPRRRV